MPVTFDDGAANLQRLETSPVAIEADRNEANTRLTLIDPLLFDCLGWDRDDCVVERRLDGAISDYELGRDGPPRLVIEAKRESSQFTLPARNDPGPVRLELLLRANPSLDTAVRQMLSYSQARGIPIGAISNGHQLLVMIATRTDGTPPLSGKCLVFPSLQEMSAHFVDLWNACSPSGLEADWLYPRLEVAAALPPPPKLSAQLIAYPGLRHRDQVETDLKVLGDLVLEDLITQPELESDFLKHCYCTTGALSQYAAISKQLLKARASALATPDGQMSLTQARGKAGPAPELGPNIIAAAAGKRPLILLGSVGVGKSIFIRHFVAVDAQDVLADAILLPVDFGSSPALSTDLENHVANHIQDELLRTYGIDINESRFVRGVYNSALNGLKRSIYGEYAESDPARYRQQELSLLESKLSDLGAHIQASLAQIAATHRREIVVFLDNIDQRPYEFQDRVFLIAQTIAASWPAAVFVSLRPETFNRSRTEGTLTAYQPRVFAISPPRIDQVIERRLRFAAMQVAGDGRLDSFPDGVYVKAPTLKAYLDLIADSLHENLGAVRLFENLSGGNVRLGLSLLNRFIGSGHVDTRRILDVVEAGHPYIVGTHKFLRAIIYGEYEYFEPWNSPVVNLFDISRPDGREHFLLPMLLSHVARIGSQHGQEGYLEVSELYAIAQQWGFTPDQVAFAVERATRKKLLASRLEENTSGRNPQVQLTMAGGYTLQQLAQSFTYVDAMVTDTPLVERDFRKRMIAQVQGIEQRARRTVAFCDYLDRQWASLDIPDVAFDWPETRDAVLLEVAEAARKTGFQLLEREAAD